MQQGGGRYVGRANWWKPLTTSSNRCETIHDGQYLGCAPRPPRVLGLRASPALPLRFLLSTVGVEARAAARHAQAAATVAGVCDSPLAATAVPWLHSGEVHAGEVRRMKHVI